MNLRVSLSAASWSVSVERPGQAGEISFLVPLPPDEGMAIDVLDGMIAMNLVDLVIVSGAAPFREVAERIWRALQDRGHAMVTTPQAMLDRPYDVPPPPVHLGDLKEHPDPVERVRRRRWWAN